MIFNATPMYGSGKRNLNGVIREYPVAQGEDILGGDFVIFIDKILGIQGNPFSFNYQQKTEHATPIVSSNLSMGSCFLDSDTICYIWNERGYINSRWYDSLHCSVCKTLKDGVEVASNQIIKSYFGAINPTTYIMGVEVCGGSIVVYYSEVTKELPDGGNKIMTLKYDKSGKIQVVSEVLVTTELGTYETNSKDYSPYILKINDHRLGVAVCGKNYTVLFKIYDIDESGNITHIATNQVYTGSPTSLSNNHGHYPFFIGPDQIAMFVNLYNPSIDLTLGTDIVVFNIDPDLGTVYNTEISRFNTEGNLHFIIQTSDRRFICYKSTPIYNNYFMFGDVTEDNTFNVVQSDMDLPSTGEFMHALGHDKVWLMYPVIDQNIFYYYSLVYELKDSAQLTKQSIVLRDNRHHLIGFQPMVLQEKIEDDEEYFMKVFCMMNDTEMDSNAQFRNYYMGTLILKQDEIDFTRYQTQVKLARKRPFNGLANEDGIGGQIIEVWVPGIDLTKLGVDDK